jgi:hypothetical protein
MAGFRPTMASAPHPGDGNRFRATDNRFPLVLTRYCTVEHLHTNETGEVPILERLSATFSVEMNYARAFGLKWSDRVDVVSR